MAISTKALCSALLLMRHWAQKDKRLRGVAKDFYGSGASKQPKRPKLVSSGLLEMMVRNKKTWKVPWRCVKNSGFPNFSCVELKYPESLGVGSALTGDIRHVQRLWTTSGSGSLMASGTKGEKNDLCR